MRDARPRSTRRIPSCFREFPECRDGPRVRLAPLYTKILLNVETGQPHPGDEAGSVRLVYPASMPTSAGTCSAERASTADELIGRQEPEMEKMVGRKTMAPAAQTHHQVPHCAPLA